MVTVTHLPGMLATATFPPCIRAMACLSAMPSPGPRRPNSRPHGRGDIGRLPPQRPFELTDLHHLQDLDDQSVQTLTSLVDAVLPVKQRLRHVRSYERQLG